MKSLFRTASLLFRSLRIYQWTKNLLVLAALLFAKEFSNPEQVLNSIMAFFAFCMASSASYLLNDLIDIEKDRAHPRKCKRPLASGELSPASAIVLMAVLFAVGAGIAWTLRPQFLVALLAYVTLTISYSLFLKNLIIIDVMTVALGFVVRAIAGAVALQVGFSNWLVVCTLFLALFLALSKRRHELTLLEGGAGSHRSVLFHYSVHYVDQLILIMAGAAIITYTIYTCSPEVVERLGTDQLYYTLPFVVYGMARYLFLVHHKTGGGDPSAALLQDAPLGLAVAGWGIACFLIIYL